MGKRKLQKIGVFSDCAREGQFTDLGRFWVPKRSKKPPKMSKKSIPNRVRKGKWFFVTFFMNFRCFFVVFLGPFFAAAFSKDGRSRKVRQVSLICYLYRILTILKVRVWLRNQKKKEISSEISMQKTEEIMFEISLKNWCKNTENLMKIGQKWVLKRRAAKMSLRIEIFPDFWRILVNFGVPRGSRNRQKIGKIRKKTIPKKSDKEGPKALSGADR